jgi:hypothetical protein
MEFNSPDRGVFEEITEAKPSNASLFPKSSKMLARIIFQIALSKSIDNFCG